MALPKRKHSKRRSRVKRAAKRFEAPQISRDPADGTPTRPHRVNPTSGTYRGRQVVTIET